MTWSSRHHSNIKSHKHGQWGQKIQNPIVMIQVTSLSVLHEGCPLLGCNHMPDRKTSALGKDPFQEADAKDNEHKVNSSQGATWLLTIFWLNSQSRSYIWRPTDFILQSFKLEEVFFASIDGGGGGEWQSKWNHQVSADSRREHQIISSVSYIVCLLPQES